MPDVKVSKIQLRRSIESDLPGAPTSTDPLEFSEGLSAGEMGFATDTGRLFIGHEPTAGQHNYDRETLPYQNIEVMTENSTDAMKRFYAGFTKSVDVDSYYESTLGNSIVNNDNAWNTVTLASDNSVFKLMDGDAVSAKISYHVLDTTGKPVRLGTMTLTHDGGSQEPRLSDESEVVGEIENFDTVDSIIEAYGKLRFRAVYNNDTADTYLTIEYRNIYGFQLKFFFNIDRVTY